MTGKTHAAVGANAAWIGLAFGAVSPEIAAVLLAVAAFGGLMPDIDAPRSKFHTLTKGVFRIIGITTQHRGFFHSVPAVFILYVAALFALWRFHPALPAALTLGYVSHIVIDMLTPGGVRVLFPIKKKFRWIPRKLAPNTGGIVDNLLFVLASGGLVLFMLHALGYVITWQS